MLQMFQYIGQNTHPNFVETGISKYSCWLCQKYLEFLSISGLNFIIAGYHEKLYPGWKPPLNGTPDACSSMIELTKQEMDEILESVVRKCRSDSYPRGQSPEGPNDPELD